MRVRQQGERATRALAGVLFLVAAVVFPVGLARADHQVTELVSTGPTGGSAAVNVDGFTISSDGLRSFFLTAEPLVASDTDAERDLYQRAAGVTTLLSTGPQGGNGPFAVSTYLSGGRSADGSRVTFMTRERLTAEDTDDQVDLYERVAETTRLVSIGASGGNGPFDVEFPPFMSKNGASVVFATQEQLTADDTNSVRDLYLRRGGETTLVTTGTPTASSEYLQYFVGMSSDGRRIFFSTARDLAGGGGDNGYEDTYRWEDGVVTLESVGTNGENGAASVYNQRIDETGSHLLFSSASVLDPDYDVGGIYVRASGTTRLASVGPDGRAAPSFPNPAGISADGSHVFFYSYARLTDADTDDLDDIYVREGNATRLVTGGPLSVLEEGLFPQFQPLHGISPDGRRAVFSTDMRLTPEDGDGTKSIYENVDGVTRWLSPWGHVEGVSADATRVFITTHDTLSPTDTDGGGPDLYELHRGETSLISTGPADARTGDPCVRNFGHPIVITCWVSISDDGRRVLFWHSTPLLAADTDFRYDVYLASAPPRRSEYGNAGSFCQAEREFMGVEAFRQRHGKGSKGSNAFKKCLQRNR